MSASLALNALALIDAGDWDGAHNLVQDHASLEAAWVHAHLHRVEGDHGNARYWYGRAAKPVARGDFAEERRLMVLVLKGRA